MSGKLNNKMHSYFSNHYSVELQAHFLSDIFCFLKCNLLIRLACLWWVTQDFSVGWSEMLCSGKSLRLRVGVIGLWLCHLMRNHPSQIVVGAFIYLNWRENQDFIWDRFLLETDLYVYFPLLYTVSYFSWKPPWFWSDVNGNSTFHLSIRKYISLKNERMVWLLVKIMLQSCILSWIYLGSHYSIGKFSFFSLLATRLFVPKVFFRSLSYYLNIGFYFRIYGV